MYQVCQKDSAKSLLPCFVRELPSIHVLLLKLQSIEQTLSIKSLTVNCFHVIIECKATGEVSFLEGIFIIKLRTII